MPTILLDRTIPGFKTIVADYASGGKKAARHLLDLGHTHIGIVSGPADVASMRQRIEAARAVIEADGTLAFLAATSFNMELEPEVEWHLRSTRATAIFAGTDLIALGVIKCLKALGKRVPEDISVIGFGDMPWCKLVTPSLSSVEIPLERMAWEGVHTLTQRIEAQPHAADSILETRLVQRSSTARHREAVLP